MTGRNETHDPALTSWLASAHAAGSDFPLQNLPFGVFRRAGSSESLRGGVAIGDQIVDLRAAHSAGIFDGVAARAAQACSAPTLNAFMAMGPAAWSALRLALSRALREGSKLETKLRGCLVAQSHAEHALPAAIGDYTDFYTSIHHATNVGRLFRPDNPLLPNYKHVPIGYHGRASSIVVSGHPIQRPLGQIMAPDARAPVLAPSRRLDYELELGLLVGPGNALGTRIPVDGAEAHIFGACIVNDWSARDIQAWEYQPLGPFLAKSFGTSISPWIVSLEALAPYRLPWTRAPDDPQPLPYLDSPAVRSAGAFDIQLEVQLQTTFMRSRGETFTVARTSYRHAYWTIAQLVAHHTVNGCNLQPGDLLATGTLSGPTAEETGALIELTAGGKNPVRLPTGETRAFLQDGDTVIMRAWCESDDGVRIGFGEVRGEILPAAA
jgi:fumarylacetoacetase